MARSDDDVSQGPKSAIIASTDIARGCREVVARARAIHSRIEAVMAADGRDVDDIPGMSDLLDGLASAIDDVCDTHAADEIEVIAKAELALVFFGRTGDRGGRVALSLAADIAQLALARSSTEEGHERGSMQLAGSAGERGRSDDAQQPCREACPPDQGGPERRDI